MSNVKNPLSWTFAIRVIQKFNNLISWMLETIALTTLELNLVLFWHHLDAHEATLVPASNCEPGSPLHY